MLAWRNFHSTYTAIKHLDGDTTTINLPVKLVYWHGYLMNNKWLGGTRDEGTTNEAEARPLSFQELHILWMIFGVLLVGLGLIFGLEIFQKYGEWRVLFKKLLVNHNKVQLNIKIFCSKFYNYVVMIILRLKGIRCHGL